MERVLCKSFSRCIKRGSLLIHFASGGSRSFGDGSGTAIEIRFADGAAERRVAFDPALALGEMYIEGRLIVEQGSVYDLMSLISFSTTNNIHNKLSKTGHGRTGTR